MAKNPELFRQAIRESLRILVAKGEPITNENIILNAKFNDGRPVGKSTLYRKNDLTKEFVHQDLLLEIQYAKDGKNIAEGKSTRTQTVSKLILEKQELQHQLGILADQVVEQEFRLRKALEGVNTDKQVVTSQEQELYVVLSVIQSITSSSSLINKYSLDFVTKYQQKHIGSELIRRANEDIKEYISDHKNSTLIDMP